jgi:glucokinase
MTSTSTEGLHRAVAVDVGGTRTKFGIVASDGSLAVPYSLPTPRDPQDLCAMIAHELTGTLRIDGLPQDAPVGIVVPGILDEPGERVEVALNLGWRDVPLGAMLREHIHAPLAFGHDVRAGGLAESAWGAGKLLPRTSPDALADLIFVPIGTGIAAAVVHDGRVFGDRYTGEIGQIQVDDPLTGSHVRLEQVASASAIARRYTDRVSGADAPAADPSADGGRIVAREVVDRARTGEREAREVLDSALDTLAQALATVIGGVGTMPVVIGGGLAEGGAIVLDTLREAISHRLGVVPDPPVLPSSLGMWAGCLGAGLLALTRATADGPGDASSGGGTA